MKWLMKAAWMFVVALMCPAAILASVSVSINPTTANVQPGGQLQFNAVVNGTTNSVVIWSLTGTNCSGITCGQITSTGLYLAPSVAPKSNVITVTATSLADLSASASAAVILGTSSDVTVMISPTTSTVLIGQQQQFVAFVSGTTITGVTWHLIGPACGSSACGTINSAGVYTAPVALPSPAQVTVEATSIADPSRSSSAVVTVALPVSVSVSPVSAQVAGGLKQQFTATVLNTSNTAVTWSLFGNGCSGSSCGTISTNGLYTAPTKVPSPAQVSVTATSVADTTKSSTATVTIIPPVSVSVSPATAQVRVNTQQQFTASVTDTPNTAVTWSVTGSGCSGSACGTISTGGLYTAPSVVPSSAQVSITATSVADPTKSSAATVTIIPPVSVSISPTTAQVRVNTQQQFTATVSNTSNTAVTWSLSGSGCSGSACGTISTSGLYTAPSAVPNPAQVSVTAKSVADTTKTSTATVTIIPPVSVSVSPSTAQLVTGKQQQFTATVSNTSNTAVTWSLSGSGCTGSACGAISSSGLYTAPSAVPSPAQILVTATSVADTTKSSTATVTIIPPVSVSISPATAQLVTGKQQQFTATVSNTSNTAVTWSVSGSGCSGSVCGTISTSGLYTAPSSVPSPALVSVTATSVADSTKSSTATVTIIPPVSVAISPASAQLLAGAHLQFTATVLNTSNTAATWSLSGSGCSGAACGTITTSGFYTAPAASPAPNQVTITATSQADSTKSANAIVTVTGPVAINISPLSAQVVTGAIQQFTASVSGTTNTGVTWSVSGGGCSGSACGTISSGGLYTAPAAVPNPALITITATSSADPTKFSTATVTVIPPVSVTISPTTANVTTSTSQQFVATVAGSTNNSVTWSVSGSGCSGSACGVITSTGFYTAPATVPSPAQVKIKVTSAADSTKSATATVTIIPAVVVKVTPSSAQIVTGATQQFSATVTGSTNTAVTWSVAGSGCTGSSCGTVTTGGLYTAPSAVPSPAQVTVTATSAADTSKSASVTVTVIPTVLVSISPSTAQVVRGNAQQFSATVKGTTNTGVSWSVAGSGCSGSACGTISSSGLYTAPTTIPSPAQVSVKATSTADSSKSATAVVTIIAPVVVTISPTSSVLAVTGQQQFQATVNGSTDTAVEWTVSGAGCSGSACGSISSSGLYTAPAAVPSPSAVSVKASAQVQPSQSASATVTIVSNQNSKLSGQYAFQFTGFDSDGVFESAGSFTADGNGNITSGLEDANRTTGPETDMSLTGTYQVSGDNRGTLTLSSTLGTQTFSFAINPTATSGRMIEFDSSGIRGSGIIEKQAATTFAPSTFAGAYVVSLAGKDSGGDRIGALAILDFNGSGTIVGGSMDVNDGGTISPTFGSFQGIYRIDSTGRGLVTLSIPGLDGGAFRFAFYVVSANKLLLVSIDPLTASNPIFGGPAERQTGAPFLASSFSGPTVFSLSGEKDNVSQALAGRISFDGISQPLVEFDENTGGTVTTGNVLTGAYSVEVNGPGTLNLDNSAGASRVWDIYAISPDHAFIMDASSADVGMGELKPQTTTAPFSASDISGSYVIGSGEPLVSGATLTSGVGDFDGKSAVTGKEDVSTGAALLSGQSLVGSYSVSSTSNDGRGTLTLTSPSGQTLALWISSAGEVLGIETDSSNAHPAVIHFEQ